MRRSLLLRVRSLPPPVIVAVLILVPVGLALLITAVRPAAPQNTPLSIDDQVNAIASGLYCPVCENTPLDVCGTQACAQWRATIREQLAAGQTEQQIKDYFVNQYGVRVLASPPVSGINIVFWLLPPLAFVILVAILVYVFRSVSPATFTPSPAPLSGSSDALPSLSDDDSDYLERLERDLDQYD